MLSHDGPYSCIMTVFNYLPWRQHLRGCSLINDTSNNVRKAASLNVDFKFPAELQTRSEVCSSASVEVQGPRKIEI
jgi:hypothetical protein